MSEPHRALLVRLVGRVRRRQFLRRLGKGFLVCCLAGLLLGAITFFVLGRAKLRGEMWALDGDVCVLRLAGLGAGVLLAGLVAACVAWLRRPSPLDAALSVDSTFRLNERVTTCMSLSDAEAASPAGQALLADAGKHIAKLHVAQAYALSPSRGSV